jgi:hypothetical protein
MTFRWKTLLRIVTVAVLTTISSAHDQSSRDNIETRELVDQAASCRVELAADLGFALLDSGKLPRRLQEQYLERLAVRAGEARRSFPFLPAPIRRHGDFRTQFLQSLSFFNLDALTIRLRAIKRMAVLDPASAREISTGLRQLLPSSSVGCEEIEVPSLGFVYYESLLPLLPDEYPFLVGRLPTLQHISSLVGALTQKHDLTMILGRPSIANYNVEQRRTATLSLISALTTIRASDRVFSTMELHPDLSVGARIEQLLRGGKVPVGLEKSLARAYAGFVERHLRGDRCADTLAANGEDRVLKTTMNRALKLAKEYGVDSFDPERIETKYSERRPVGIARDAAREDEKRNLLALSGNLREFGAPDLRERLADAAGAYAKRRLSESDAGFDVADRCLTLLGLSLAVAGDPVAPRLLALFFGLLEEPALKEAEPVAWIVLARLALNELHDPNPLLAAEAARALRQTRDRDLSLYFRVRQNIGLTPIYQREPLSNFQGILAKY